MPLRCQDRGISAVSWYDIQNGWKDYQIISIDVIGDAREGDDVDSSVVALIKENPFGVLDPRKRYSLDYDIARTGHLSSMWVNETDGHEHRFELHVKLHKCKFSSQRELIYDSVKRNSEHLIGHYLIAERQQYINTIFPKINIEKKEFLQEEKLQKFILKAISGLRYFSHFSRAYSNFFLEQTCKA